MQYTRHRLIVDRLRRSGPLTVDELRTLTGAGAATIRRDLGTLEEVGLLSRVHGGAVLTPRPPVDGDTARPFAAVAAEDPCGPEALDVVVTNADADPTTVGALRAAGCEVRAA